jgi:hypothetical protein
MPVLAACYIEMEGISSVLKTIFKIDILSIAAARKYLSVEKSDVNITHY